MCIYRSLIMFDHVMGWAIVWGCKWAWDSKGLLALRNLLVVP